LPEISEISVAPNPFNSAVKISINGCKTPLRIEIFDITGKFITALSPLRGTIEGTTAVWTPSPETASGVYFIRINNAGGKIEKPVVFIK
jgi:hypothetical protein